MEEVKIEMKDMQIESKGVVVDRNTMFPCNPYC